MNQVTLHDSAAGTWGTGANALLVPIDGNYAGTFPDAQKTGLWVVQYTVNGQVGVPVIDVEPGCVWPPSAAVPWVLAELGANRRPTIYGAAWTLQTMSAELAPHGLAIGTDHRVDGFLAAPDGVREVPFPYVAKQYYWGATYDISVALSEWSALKPHDPPVDS